jgi:hypothetical protein
MNKLHPSSVSFSAKVMIVSDDPSSPAIWAFALQQASLATCLAPPSDKAIDIWTEEHPWLPFFPGVDLRRILENIKLL